MTKTDASKLYNMIVERFHPRHEPDTLTKDTWVRNLEIVEYEPACEAIDALFDEIGTGKLPQITKFLKLINPGSLKACICCRQGVIGGYIQKSMIGGYEYSSLLACDCQFGNYLRTKISLPMAGYEKRNHNKCGQFTCNCPNHEYRNEQGGSLTKTECERMYHADNIPF